MNLNDLSPLTIPRVETFTRDGVVRVETLTLLPGGDLVTLMVRKQGERYTVDDGGTGRAVLMGLGIQDLTAADARRGSDTATKLGVTYWDGVFRFDDARAAQLPAAMSYVAEACRSWTTTTVETRQRARERDLVGTAFDRLRALFPGSQMDLDRSLAGSSSKLHRFDIVLSLPRDRCAVFESMLPVQSSIAATHLKFYDLKEAHPDWPREAMVEDLSAWSSADLAVMQQVTTGVRPIAGAWEDLTKLAA